MPAIDISSVIHEFTQFLHTLGFDRLNEIIADGERHRTWVRTPSGRLTRDGVYVLHLNGLPAGWAQCHAGGGEVHRWRYDPGHVISAAQQDAFRVAEAETMRRRTEKREREAHQAAQNAERIWARSQAANPRHVYLAKKGVGVHGIRQQHMTLIVPMCAIYGEMRSAQMIDEAGGKRFLRGAAVTGAMHIIGHMREAQTVLIGEGYATMATCYEVTGIPTIAAFDCHNLRPVAEAVRDAYPEIDIIICADDDYLTKDARGRLTNPGLRYARAAAAVVDGRVAVPVWTDPRRSIKSTDFNDLACDEGVDAVSYIITRIADCRRKGSAVNNKELPNVYRDRITARM